MRSSKRLLSTIVGLLLTLGLAACDSSEDFNSSNRTVDSNNTTETVLTNTDPVLPDEPPVPRRYALHDAARLGLIEYQVTGNGYSSGPALQLQLRRTTAEPIELYVDPGTVFGTGSQGVQSMAARSILREIAEGIAEEIIEAAVDESGVIELVDDATHTYLLEAYCLDFELANPSERDAFAASSADARTAALFEAADEQRPSVRAMQVAIWMDRDGATPEAISEVFRFTAEDLEAATRLLTQLPPR